MPPMRRKRRTANNKKKIAVSTVKILDLNDHCLLNIFRYLSSIDMCDVKDTCQRFRGLAEKQMEKILKSKEVVVSTSSDCIRRNKIFFKFCGVLSKLNISIENLQSHQKIGCIHSTIRRCNPTLDSLTVSDSDFQLTRCTLRPLFSSLRKIKLEYCDNDFQCDIKREETTRDLLKACTNVEELSFGAKVSVLGSCYQCIFLQMKFKKLRSLELCDVRDIDLNNLKIFFKLNPKVVKLLLKCCVRVKELNDCNLVDCAPHIEAISIQFNISEYLEYQYMNRLLFANKFSKFEKLKYLALDTCGMDITNFITIMAERNSLIHLSLTNIIFKINERFGEAFANMNNLKILWLELRFFYIIPGDPPDLFTKMCKNLVNLEELYLFKCNMCVQQTKDIVENAVNLKKLYLPSLRLGLINEDLYLNLVELQRRKNVDWPLTIFLENEFSFPNVIQFIPSHVLLMNTNVIRFLEFQPSLFDYYAVPV